MIGLNFTHRKTRNCFDSICMKCYATVGYAANEADLAIYEQQHRCEYPLRNGPAD